MIRLHNALPGVGLAIDVAADHIVSLVPCDEGVEFEAARHPGARTVVCTSDGRSIYVTEGRDSIRDAVDLEVMRLRGPRP